MSWPNKGGAGGGYALDTSSSVINTLIKGIIGQQIGTQSTPVVPAPIPSVLPTTFYYIDPLNSNTNNANAGTSPSAPWADVSNIVGKTFGPGSVINIAGDATFTYSQTLANYTGSPTFPFNGCDNVQGSATSPVVIQAYYPRGSTGSKPSISWNASILSGDWTNENGNTVNTVTLGPNIWSIPYTGASVRSQFLAFGTAMTLGVAQEFGGSGPVGNFPGQLQAAMQYAPYNNKIYVYSVGNPTTTFGTVTLFGQAIFSSFYAGLRYTKINGLQFNYCLGVYMESSAPTVTRGLEICHNTLIGARLCEINNKSTTTQPQEMQVSIHDNIHKNNPAMAIHLQTLNGTAGNTLSWQVYREQIYNGNLSHSQGGALLYNQSVGGTQHIAWGNYGYGCLNGTGGRSIDGCMLYSDYLSNNTIFFGNISQYSAIGFQANNSLNCYHISNLTIDCLSFNQITGSSDVNLAGQAYTGIHNTWLWTGNVAAATIQRGPNAPQITSSAFIEFNTNFGSFGNKFASFTMLNNMAISFVPLTKPVSVHDTAGITTTLVEGYFSAGLTAISAVINSNNGSPIDLTLSAGVLPVYGGYTDALAWFPSYSTAGLVFAPDCPLIGAGMPLSTQYTDIFGNQFAQFPTPGCYEPQANMTAKTPATALGNIKATGNLQAAGGFNAPYILLQKAIPFILSPSGTMANNGAVTFGTALNTTYSSGAWMYYPAGAIVSAGAAGWYWTVMSSSTIGTVYNVTYTSGDSAAPTLLPAFVTTGPGAFTQTTADVAALTMPIAGGSLGNNGEFAFRLAFSNNSSTNQKTMAVRLGSTIFWTDNTGSGTTTWESVEGAIFNRNAQNVNVSGMTSFGGGTGRTTNSQTYGTVDTSTSQSVSVHLQLATATDYVIIEAYSFEIRPGQ